MAPWRVRRRRKVGRPAGPDAAFPPGSRLARANPPRPTVCSGKRPSRGPGRGSSRASCGRTGVSYRFDPQPDPFIRQKLAANPYLLAHSESFWRDVETVWRVTRGQPEATVSREAFLRESARRTGRTCSRLGSSFPPVPSATQENVRTQIESTPLPEMDRRRLRDLLIAEVPCA